MATSRGWRARAAPATAQAGGGVTSILLGATNTGLAFVGANARPDLNVEPFKGLRVRQALNRALNREAIAAAIPGDVSGTATGEGLASITFGHNPDVKPYPYDPAKARQLLAEAGYGAGLSFPVEAVSGRLTGFKSWNRLLFYDQLAFK